MKLLPIVCFVIVLAGYSFGQTVCGGANVLTEPKCFGDDIAPDERELVRIINEYRAQNRLPAIAASDSLSMVANRHLIDLTENIGKLTHAWSDCPYDIKVEATWPCIIKAPARLKSGYKGDGFENLYRNQNSAATPSLALEGWKRSPMHNGLMLNLDIWKTSKFDALGVSIRGNWAAVWFGRSGGGTVGFNREIKGLGISYEKLISGLGSFMSFDSESSVSESEKWVGESADKSVKLEIYGTKADIAETSIGISARLKVRTQLSADNRAVILMFLKNLSPNWLGREKWFNDSLAKLLRNSRVPKRATIENKVFEMKIGADRVLTIGVRPNRNKAAIEL